MKRFVFAMLAAGIPALYAADALPSAEQILDRYIEVTGGKQNYAKVKSEYMSATLEFPAQGVKGSIKRWSAEGGKYYSTLEIGGIGNVEMGVSDGIAWEKSAIMGPRIKSGEERAQAIREATLNAMVQWKKLFPKTEVAGVETIDGEECYKVVMAPAQGQPQTMYFQKKSGLAVRTTTIGVSQAGEIPITIDVSGYKSFDGILAPVKTTQKAAGQEFTITINSVETNTAIAEEKFALPPDIRALAGKSAGAAAR